MALKQPISLKKFIFRHFKGNQSRFAEANEVSRQQVNVWLSKHYIVYDSEMYSHRRTLKRR